MNKNELVKNLKKEIQDIYSKINEFEKSDQIHLIDIDLALSKVRNLYELLSKLNTTSIYTSENQPEEILTKTKQLEETKEVKAVIEEKPFIEEKKESVKKVTAPETEKAKQEPEFIIEKANKEPEKEIREKTKEEDSGNEKQEYPPEIFADKFQSKKFMHDNIAKKNSKKDVSSKMQSKPIHDINSAIGLNDKFIFIRELFGGDKDHYNETIQLLNNFDTYENAIGFLNENFEWDEDDSNFERLKELVQRKYSVK
jgi:hypothetical protein